MAKPSKQEWIEHLADILLKTGEIASNERPYRITRQGAVDHAFDLMQDSLPLEAYFASWEDEEGEKDTEAHKAMLDFTVEAAKEFIDITLQDYESDYSSWGKPE